VAPGEDDAEQDENGSTAQAAAGTDRPDSVPAKASTTVKEINGNRYYYWQWRDGGEDPVAVQRPGQQRRRFLIPVAFRTQAPPPPGLSAIPRQETVEYCSEAEAASRSSHPIRPDKSTFGSEGVETVLSGIRGEPTTKGVTAARTSSNRS